MAPSCCIELSRPERLDLLEVARDALVHGLASARPPQPALEQASPALRRASAAFVTLTCSGRLRGCIGSLEASAPLLWAVADAAHGAGFRDSRFAAIEARELAGIYIEISVLAPLEPLNVSSRAELLAILRPQRDGLLLRAGKRGATFLPKVWEQLPEPDKFLDHLLAKAGLSGQRWPEQLRCFRYEALSFGEKDRFLT